MAVEVAPGARKHRFPPAQFSELARPNHPSFEGSGVSAPISRGIACMIFVIYEKS